MLYGTYDPDGDLMEGTVTNDKIETYRRTCECMGEDFREVYRDSSAQTTKLALRKMGYRIRKLNVTPRD